MANNYLQFSEAITISSPEERDWLQAQLETVFYGSDGKIYADMDTAPADVTIEELPRFIAEAPADQIDKENSDGAFEAEFEETDLWVHADESGNVDVLAYFAQQYLKKFAPDCYWSCTWATTCGKPRLGEFGGGGVFVTATEIKWQNAYSFIEQCRTEFEATQGAQDANTQ